MSDIKQVCVPSIILRDAPGYSAENASELLYGEKFKILEEHGEFVHGIALNDEYEGYIPAEALSDDIFEPTHKVTALQAYIYAEPNFKSPPLASLPFLSNIKVGDENHNEYVQINNGGWIWKDLIKPLNFKEHDYIKTAQNFLNAPYLWGGRTSQGIDCSGLVQLSLIYAGIDCPRDTSEQIEEFSENIEPSNIQGGDLVYFERHVGIMINTEHILNATSRTMDTRIETLNNLEKIYDGILAIKRPKK